MSIIIFAKLENKGELVQRIQIPVGYNVPEAKEFRSRVIWEIMINHKFLKGKLPAFDKVTVASENVDIDGGVFSAPFSFRDLLRQGVDPQTVYKLAFDHKAALEKLDRSAYDLAQNMDWADAVEATNILLSDLNGGTARG